MAAWSLGVNWKRKGVKSDKKTNQIMLFPHYNGATNLSINHLKKDKKSREMLKIIN